VATDATARVALLHGIYLIVNDGTQSLAVARAGLDAGIRIVQYRAKNGVDPERLRALRVMTDEREALLLCNDDWRAALAFDCDGVHLGPGDSGFDDIAPVRAALGPRLIGLSCGTLDEIRAANRLGVDYAGVGSVFATASKADAGEPIGLEGLTRIASATVLPVAAIGGIDASNAHAVRETGVAMAAVISAIASAGDPIAAARQLVAAWETAVI
jgi:thiamine-phosphate pyrophosphorylase